MLTLLIVAWLVVVLVLLAVVGFRAVRLQRRIKRLRAEIDRALPRVKLDEMNARLTALQNRQAELSESVASLQRAVAGLMVLRGAADDALEPLLALRALLRR